MKFPHFFFIGFLLSAACIHLEARLIDTGRPYLVPEIATADDFDRQVYIDSSAESGGDGSEQHPLNYINTNEWEEGTAYLVRAGSVFEVGLNGVPAYCYVGSYGEGDRPVFRGHGAMFSSGNDVTIDGLVLEKYGTGNYDRILNIGVDNVVFSRCRISGLDDGNGYPHYILKGGHKGMTFYACELSYSRNDGFYLGGRPDMSFVSNWLHHQNMSDGSGDGIQLEYSGYDNFYFANNYVDRSHKAGKFGLICNGTEESGVVVEWNTFISPHEGRGGAAVRWLAGENNRFNKNLLIVGPGTSGVATYDVFANQEAPYGIRDNHAYGVGSLFYGIGSWADDNLKFADEVAYEAFLEEQGMEAYGSDLFKSVEASTGDTLRIVRRNGRILLDCSGPDQLMTLEVADSPRGPWSTMGAIPQWPFIPEVPESGRIFFRLKREME